MTHGLYKSCDLNRVTLENFSELFLLRYVFAIVWQHFSNRMYFVNVHRLSVKLFDMNDRKRAEGQNNKVAAADQCRSVTVLSTQHCQVRSGKRGIKNGNGQNW